MKKLISSILFVLMSSSAQASIDSVLTPPPKYDHAYHGKIHYKFIPLERIAATCHLNDVNACSWHKSKDCWMVLPKLSFDISTYKEYQLIRHETAHCNGWPANHPGGF